MQKVEIGLRIVGSVMTPRRVGESFIAKWSRLARPALIEFENDERKRIRC